MKAAIANPAVFAGLSAGFDTMISSAGLLGKTAANYAQPSDHEIKLNKDVNSFDMK